MRQSAQLVKLWLTPEEAADVLGNKRDAVYRDIREGKFPFEYVRIGKRIKISARSLGVITETATTKSEAQTGNSEVFQDAA